MLSTKQLSLSTTANFILNKKGRCHKLLAAAFFLFFVLGTNKCFAQDSTLMHLDSSYSEAHYIAFDNQSNPLSPQIIRKRTRLMGGIQIGGYSSAMVGLYAMWYKNYPQSKFHFFNDIDEWKGLDKMGHVFSAYGESKASMELWRWTGIERKKRIWYGGMSGFAYQTVIEILDGFSAEWGFSLGDFAANITGSGMLIAQELAWDEQRIQMKWSFHRKSYNDPLLNERSDKLFGKTPMERFIKDYNGQNFWLSANLHSFFPESGLPKWLNVSIGSGADGMFGGFDNIGKDKEGNIVFDRSDIKRQRQWFLAPDVDLTKIKTNKKGLRIALDVLNILKFPTPALEYKGGKFYVRPIVY